jgi:hypothetical protein
MSTHTISGILRSATEAGFDRFFFKAYLLAVSVGMTGSRPEPYYILFQYYIISVGIILYQGKTADFTTGEEYGLSSSSPRTLKI